MRAIIKFFMTALALTLVAKAETSYYCNEFNGEQRSYLLVIRDNDTPTLDGLPAEIPFMETDTVGVYLSYWLAPNFNRVYFMRMNPITFPDGFNGLKFEILIARGKDVQDMEPLNAGTGICSLIEP